MEPQMGTRLGAKSVKKKKRKVNDYLVLKEERSIFK